MSPVTLEIREDGIVTSRPVYIKSSFQNDTKRPAICVIAPGKEEVNQLASTFNTIDKKNANKRRTFGSCIYTNTFSEI